MAYVAEVQEQDPNQPVRLAQAGGGGGSVGAASVVGGAAPSTASGSGFTNINAFLNSRVNQAGGTQMAGQVASDLQREVTEANQAITTGQQEFNRQAGANTVNFNQGALNTTLRTGQAPTAITRGLQGTYSGPRNLTEAGVAEEIEKQRLEAEQRAEMAGTQGGRSQYLQELVNRPMSAGVARLNAALLGGSEQGISRIGEQAAKAGEVEGRFNTVATAAEQRAKAAEATNKATKAKILNELNTYLDAQNAAKDRQIEEMKADVAARGTQGENFLAALERMKAEALQEGRVTTPRTPPRSTAQSVPRTSPRDTATPVNAPIPAGWETLGITRAQAQALANAAAASKGGVELSDYWDVPDVSGTTRGAFLSEPEAARLNALAALAGRARDYRVSSVPGNGLTFDYDQALADLQAAKYVPNPIIPPGTITRPVTDPVTGETTNVPRNIVTGVIPNIIRNAIDYIQNRPGTSPENDATTTVNRPTTPRNPAPRTPAPRTRVGNIYDTLRNNLRNRQA